jgi:hypothetical protein
MRITKRNNQVRKSNSKNRKENKTDFNLPKVASNNLQEPICLECYDRNQNLTREEEINED